MPSGPDERAAHAEWFEALEPTRVEARHVGLGLRRVVDGKGHVHAALRLVVDARDEDLVGSGY